MVAGRSICAPADLEAVDEELSKVIDDFDRATNIEALRIAKRSGMHSLSLLDISFLVDSCSARIFA